MDPSELPADRFEFTTIAHRDLRVLNPLSDTDLDRALALLPLGPGDPVLDVGCGKGEMLLRLAERRGVRGTGLDLNPSFVEDARRAAASRLGGADGLGGAAGARGAPGVASLGAAALDFRCEDASVLAAAPDGSFAAALCVGSTHALGGLRPTLTALARLVRPGGGILVGEGFWRRAPDPDYLAFLGTTADAYLSHEGNLAAGAALGLDPLASSAATEEDWDRYEGAYAAAVERHAAGVGGTAGAAAAAARHLGRIRAWRDAYLRWGRSTLGFGLYVFRR